MSELEETYGYSTRAVKSPTASTGAHARVAGGRDKPGTGDRSKLPSYRDKFVPLSVFFARMEGEPTPDDEDTVYGYRSKKKKKKDPDAPSEKDKDKSAKEKNADANRQNGAQSGKPTAAGDAGVANQALNTAGERQESKERTFTPPASVRKAAARGLELRRKHGRGGLDTSQASSQGIGSGVQRAVNLKNGDAISLETVKRMKAFFARHEKNKGKPGDTSAGRIAWLLWGGNAGRAWANKIVRDLEEASVGQPGTPGLQGLPVRTGASHVATGGTIHGTGAGNIATAPVPIGRMLRRLPRRKKKRKKKDDRSKWIERMLGS